MVLVQVEGLRLFLLKADQDRSLLKIGIASKSVNAGWRTQRRLVRFLRPTEMELVAEAEVQAEAGAVSGRGGGAGAGDGAGRDTAVPQRLARWAERHLRS